MCVFMPQQKLYLVSPAAAAAATQVQHYTQRSRTNNESSRDSDTKRNDRTTVQMHLQHC